VAIHRFAVTVPNPSSEAVASTLTLETVPAADLAAAGYSLPSRELRVRAASLAVSGGPAGLLGCSAVIWLAWRALVAWVRRMLGLAPSVAPLHVELEPRGSIEVTVAIDVQDADGVAAVHLVDRRAGRIVGGVTLLAVNGLEAQPAVVIDAAKPCPLAVDGVPHWSPPGAEPDDPGFGPSMPFGSEVQLVVWIANRSETLLEQATAYLEHLGGSGARFDGITWHLGDLEPGARFPLVWTVSGRQARAGGWTASVVAAAAGFDPTRIPVRIGFAEQQPDLNGPTDDQSDLVSPEARPEGV
jgi:hypothetical protein